MSESSAITVGGQTTKVKRFERSIDRDELPDHLVRVWNAFTALGTEFGYADLAAYLDHFAARS
jgi:hypothetical protein